MISTENIVHQSIEKHGKFLIPILEDIQEHYRYLPEDVLKIVAKELNIPLVDVYGVATFYQAFSLEPKGDHVITVCCGTACYIRGGAKILKTLSKELHVLPGKTTKDGKFTLETVNCLGCCASGPVVLIDGEINSGMTPQKILDKLNSMKACK
jgi:NADH-quinone oxidoreductase subunit E